GRLRRLAVAGTAPCCWLRGLLLDVFGGAAAQNLRLDRLDRAERVAGVVRGLGRFAGGACGALGDRVDESVGGGTDRAGPDQRRLGGGHAAAALMLRAVVLLRVGVMLPNSNTSSKLTP